MKRITLLLLFLSSLAIYAQERRVSATIGQLNSSHQAFKAYSPLTVATVAPKGKTVKNATYANLNTAVVQEIAKTKPQYIEVTVPYNGATVTAQLYRVQVTGKGFHMDTDKQKNVAYRPGAHYRGIIKGDPKSVASVNFFAGEMNGILSGKGYNNLVIGRLGKSKDAPGYIVYSDSKLNLQNEFACATPDGKGFGKKQQTAFDAATPEVPKCVGIYFEIDYSIYQANDSDITLTGNWITSIFNNIQTLYDNDGIDVYLKSFYVYTEQDPYDNEDNTSSNDYLMQFYANYADADFDGNIGQLIGIDNGGYGGLAIIAGLCGNQNVSYVDVVYEFEDVPLFSWNVEAMTHEIGHQLGSEHTHGCVWNGNNTAIDGCGTSMGFVEGDCEQAEIPYENKGTIMSYCHLLWDVGIDLSNGFGPQPAQRIKDHIEAANCLTYGCLTDCENPVTGIGVDGVTTTSAHVSWDINGSWQRSVATLAGIYSDWDDLSGDDLTLNDLEPNTYYKVGVRMPCDGGASSVEEVVFATDADWCSGSYLFTDSGGATGGYTNNQNIIRTLRPDEATRKVIVEFTDLDIEENYDFLTVYDGPDTESPVLAMFSGTEIPGTFTSTAADGSLTIQFISDYYGTAGGWSANVSCTEPTAGIGEVAFANFTYYPNPAKNNVTISSSDDLGEISIYNIAGQLLSVQRATGSRAVADISAFADGVYFFKVSNGTKVANFRIVKQ